MPQPPITQIHATCVELSGIAVLLRGDSGCGKSDLALRLIDGGARLVADDRTDLAVREGALIASAPVSISGKLEVRGVGIVESACVANARVGLAVDLLPAEKIERLPQARRCAYLGIELPLIALAPFECSAVAKLRLAAREAALGHLVAA